MNNQYLKTCENKAQPIPQYPDYYIDLFGNVTDSSGKPVTIYHYLNEYDSFMVRRKNGSPTILRVHQAVAMTYLPDWFEGCIVHHIDGNKYNNNVNNLRCETRAEHSRHHGQKYFDKVERCQMCGNQFIWTAKQQQVYYVGIKSGLPRFKTCSKSCGSKIGRFRQLGYEYEDIINHFDE